MELSVSQLTTEYLDRFISLRLEALQNHPEAFGSDFAQTKERPHSWWVERHLSNDSFKATFLAEHNEKLIGMAGILQFQGAKLNHDSLIWGVYVRPEARGQGTVDALFAAIFFWAEQRNISKLKLAVAATNAPAINAYLRLGFTVYGIEPDVIRTNGHSYNELLMVKILSPFTPIKD